jgi:hypothetical protein
MTVEIKPQFILITKNGFKMKYIGYSVTEAKKLFKNEYNNNCQKRPL